MKYTNKYKLPSGLVNAIVGGDYDLTKANLKRISVTTLINPPLQRILQVKYWNKIEDDVSKHLWRILGNAGHYFLSIGNNSSYMVEEKMEENVDDFTIVAKPDVYDWDKESIEDYKITSIWSVKLGDKDDWENQLNCYDKDTEVLTENGWKFFKNISKKDRIYSLNTIDHTTFYQNYIAFQKKKYNGKLLHYTGKNIDLLVTPDHNIYYKKPLDKEYRLQKASKIKNKRIHFKKDGKWFGFYPDPKTIYEIPKVNSHLKKHRIPKKFFLKDYVEFMGWYLSEGCLIHRKNRKNYDIEISQSINKNLDNCKRIERLLKRLKVKYRYTGKSYIFSEQRIFNFLEKFGRSSEKFIPYDIKSLNPYFLKKFLKAYSYGDGSKNGEGWQITTKSSKMANDLQEIIHKAGYCSTISKNNRDLYIVSLYKARNFNILNYPKLKKYKGYVYDVSLPKHHVMLIRRNGKTVWSGNCYAWMLRQKGLPVKSLFINALLKDWRKNEGKKYDDYPRIPFKRLKVKLWSHEEQKNYIEMRLHIYREQIEMNLKDVPICGPKERWKKDDSYAVYKNNNTKAVRVLDTMKKAKTWAKNNIKSPDKSKVVKREGGDLKCQEYCSVNKFCSYWKEKYGNK